jgi:hypothetical protein
MIFTEFVNCMLLLCLGVSIFMGLGFCCMFGFWPFNGRRKR